MNTVTACTRVHALTVASFGTAKRVPRQCGAARPPMHAHDLKSRHDLNTFRVVTSRVLNTDAPASDDAKEALSGMSGVMTDDTVPEAHKGLHSFLYGDGTAHDAEAVYKIRQGEDDGTTIMPTESYLEARNLEKPLGVYATYTKDMSPQYIGFSRNVVLALKGHSARLGEEKCALVRVMVFANKAMATRDNMQAEVDNWISECETVPPGNAHEAELWSEQRPVKELVAAMTPEELADYEEKKLRMRKAMGENLFDDVQNETMDAKTRRMNFLNAVEGDDWSGVIDGQTQQTISEEPEPEEEQIISPFTRSAVGGAEVIEIQELTIENADKVLDEVRPYLIADGGNVELVGIENGIVALRLIGACGTCPSSTATMQQGIEKALQRNFGDALKEVVQVDKIDITASPMTVNAHLDVLRPAITNYGGIVDVVSVKNGVCDVNYTGPAPLEIGISAAIKDKFPDIREVKFMGLAA